MSRRLAWAISRCWRFLLCWGRRHSHREGWCGHGCGAGGAIYDLASVLEGGPTGRWLRGEHFRRARSEVRRRLGAQ